MYKFYIGILALLFSSCSVGPDYVPPETYNEGQIKTELNLITSTKERKKWYDFFQDEQLQYLIAQGIKNNANINIAKLRLQQSRSVSIINKASFLPQVGLTGTYQYEKVSKNIGPAADSRYYSLGFDASWEVDIWGKGRRQNEADLAAISAAHYNVSHVKLIITAEIITNYIKLAQNQEKLRIAQQNATSQQNLVNIIYSKYTNGLVGEVDYNQAKYLLAEIKSQIPEFSEQTDVYKNAIAVLLETLPSQLPIAENKIKILSQKLNFRNDFVYELPADIIRKRPDIAMAEQQLIQQNAKIGEAIADLYPAVNLSAVLGYAARSTGRIIASSSQTDNYSPAVTLPLLNWNKLTESIKLQQLEKEEALVNYKNTIINAISELKKAITAYQNNLAINKQQEISLATMRKTLDLKLKQYENGLTDYSDVLQAQQNCLSAENKYIDSKSQIYQSIVTYYKATGSFYQ